MSGVIVVLGEDECCENDLRLVGRESHILGEELRKEQSENCSPN